MFVFSLLFLCQLVKCLALKFSEMTLPYDCMYLIHLFKIISYNISCVIVQND